MLTDGYITDRLEIEHWQPKLDVPARRDLLEAALAGILTPVVLAPLPEPLHLPSAGIISDWVTARASESDVFTVTERARGEMIGLLILASSPREADPVDVHLGYLLAESAWGRGFASELVSGLVDAAVEPATGCQADRRGRARQSCLKARAREGGISTRR